MDNRLMILIGIRILTFFLAIFLVANMIFLQFFVLNHESRILLHSTGDPELREAVFDDLALDGSLADQYTNFMTKTLSGEFFISSGVRKYVPASELVYNSALITGVEVISVLAIALVAAGLYGILASMWSARIRGKIMLSLALIGAVSFVVPMLIWIELLMAEMDCDAFQKYPLIWSVAMASIPVSAAFVFIIEGFLRRNGPVDLRRPYESFLKLASGRSFSAILPIFLVYTTTCVLLVNAIAFRDDGLGRLILDALISLDYQVLIACMFVTAVMVLAMILIADVLAIHASIAASRRFDSHDSDSKEAACGKTALLNGPSRSAASSLLRTFRRSRVGMVALIALVIMLAVGVLAPLLSTVQDPEDVANHEPNVMIDTWVNPHSPSLTPSPYTGFTHPLGTDHVGRDVYSILLYDSLESIGTALLIVVLSVVVGVCASFFRAIVQYFCGPAKEVVGWCGWLLSDVFLSVPIFLVFAAIYMTSRPVVPVMLLLIALLAFVGASFAKGQAAGLLLRLPPPRDYGPPFKALSVSEVLHVGKYCFLLCFFSIAFVDFLFHSSEWLSVGWVDLIETAYNWGAAYRGAWWLIVPPMIMIGLVAASIFVIMDRLERVLHSWSAAPETGSD